MIEFPTMRRYSLVTINSAGNHSQAYTV